MKSRKQPKQPKTIQETIALLGPEDIKNILSLQKKVGDYSARLWGLGIAMKIKGPMIGCLTPFGHDVADVLSGK